ncbi:MAG TPA: hypothetical protein PK668_19560 [Myxococcota bacterium]|nr:hypothetical protein [Myxococcota bacterium]HRY95070.1 hypothetical protein [Myxococcota bacterium]HSA22085.1 hypothetical protein [Myxococcota bacterium]
MRNEIDLAAKALGLCALLACLAPAARARAAEGGCPDKDPRCKEVSLVAPGDARRVVLEREGVRMTFGLSAFEEAAKARNDRDLIALLASRKGDEIRLEPDKMKDGWLANAVLFAAARLLEEGKAGLVVIATGQPATRVLVQQWDWIGCSGGCRQAGREFRLKIPGAPFLRLTDMFEDGEPGTF